MTKDENFLTIKDFARRTHYSERQIRQMCIDGRIKAQKLGIKSRKWLIPESEGNRFTDQMNAVSDERVHKNVTTQETAAITLRSMQLHFDHLADMASALVSGGLDRIVQIPKREVQGRTFEYVGETGQYLTREQISSTFKENEENADLEFGTQDLIDLMLHAEVEYPEIRAKGIGRVIEENPYGLIKVLRVLARRKTFKGTCPVCKEW